MRILVIVSSLRFGGAEKQAVLDANILSEDNVVYLSTFKSESLLNQINPTVNLVLIKKQGYLLTVKRLTQLIKNKKIQVIHASLFSPMIISALASILIKVSVIWNFHSHEYDIPRRSEIAFKYLSRLSSVKKILFVNAELKKYFISRFNLPQKKLGILYNSSSIKSVLRLKTTSKTIIIGYVGRLVKLKRVDYLIDLAEYLTETNSSSFKIIVIGDGEERDFLKSYSKNKFVDRYIDFIGFQPKPEAYYHEFHLFINPSGEECLSMALIDAGLSSVPAIAFNVGGNEEIVLNGRSGYIVETKQEMFEKTRYLMGRKKLRISMGKAAQQYCSKKFSEEGHKQKMLEIYEEALQNA
jgi:L-malate glycosyltransferase